jgi:hypothetical protein
VAANQKLTRLNYSHNRLTALAKVPPTLTEIKYENNPIQAATAGSRSQKTSKTKPKARTQTKD